MPEQLAYRTADAAHRVGVGRTKFFALLKAGEIKSIKDGGVRLVPDTEIRAYLERKLRSAA